MKKMIGFKLCGNTPYGYKIQIGNYNMEFANEVEALEYIERIKNESTGKSICGNFNRKRNWNN